jgi:hypothetical protein
MRGSQLLLASVIGVLITLLTQQPSAAQPARPGSGITLQGGLRTLGPSLKAGSSAPYKQYVDSIRNPPKPSTDLLLQSYITDLTGNPVSTSIAENGFVTIGGKTALQLKIHDAGTSSIFGQGATIKLPTTALTITDSADVLKYNFKVDADTSGHASSAESFFFIYVVYSTPPSFTDTQFALARNTGLPGPGGVQPTIVTESDGSKTITFKRINFLIYPNYLFDGVFVPSGSRIKKIGFSNGGWNNATITWTIKDVLLNNKPVGADLNGLHYDSPFQPYRDY